MLPAAGRRQFTTWLRAVVRVAGLELARRSRR